MPTAKKPKYRDMAAQALELSALQAMKIKIANAPIDPDLQEGGFPEPEPSLSWGNFTYKRSSVDRSEEANLEMKDDLAQQDIKDVSEAFQVSVIKDRTLVTAIVVDKRGGNNKPFSIRCHHGTALGGYAYDQKSDSYIVACVDVQQVGWINRGFLVSLPQTGNWRISVPLPSKVIDRHLTGAQRRVVKELADKYNEEHFEIHYVQMHGCSE